MTKNKSVFKKLSSKLFHEGAEEHDIRGALIIGHRLLTAVVVTLAVLVLIKIIRPSQDFTIVYPDQTMTQVFDEEPIESLAPKKPFDVYAASLHKKDLFGLATEMNTAQTAVLEKAMPALHKRIKLIGILVDNDSKAIVEDLQEKQTHFLSQGERVGNILLQEIQENKVIFNDDGKTVEMAL